MTFSLRNCLISIGIAILLTIYFIVDPADSIWMPKCVFHALTGLDCPGCGSQRFLHAIMHGDLYAAWKANAMIFFTVPYIILLSATSIFPNWSPRIRKGINSTTGIIVAASVVILWWIVRNII